MLDVGIRAGLELVADDAAAGDGFKGDGPDELAGGPRHDGRHVMAALLQPTGDFDGLIGADPAANSQPHQGHQLLASVDLLDLALAHFLLRKLCRLVAALALRRAAAQQLPRAGASHRDELECVSSHCSIVHFQNTALSKGRPEGLRYIAGPERSGLHLRGPAYT